MEAPPAPPAIPAPQNSGPQNYLDVQELALAKTSTYNYVGAIRRVIAWLKINAPDTLVPHFQQMSDINLLKMKALKGLPFPLADNFDIINFKQYLTSLLLTTQLSSSTLGTYRSALKYLFQFHGRPFNAAWKSDLETFFKGAKRQTANQKQNGIGKAIEGKLHMQFDLYRVLCKELLRIGDTSSIFAHAYLTISWNLICRAGNTEEIHFNHMSWESDALGVIFVTSKTDLSGEKPRDPRHIYANPLIPEVCTITALGIYLLCFDLRTATKLFTGNDQYDRYRKYLQKLFQREAVRGELVARGINSDDLGTHSTRKGAATFVLSGSTGGPSFIPVALRCGWKLEGVTSRYLRYEAAGDQFVGRTVAGLPLDKAEFAILPPFFRQRTDRISTAIALAFPSPPPGLQKEILEMCLASVVYHRAYLKNTLPATHPLFQTALFRDPELLSLLAGDVVCRTHHTGDRVSPTGLSPTTVFFKHFEEIKASLDALQGKVGAVAADAVRGIMEELEKQAIHSDAVTPTGLKKILH